MRLFVPLVALFGLVPGANADVIFSLDPGFALDLVTVSDFPPTFFAGFDIRNNALLTFVDPVTSKLVGPVLITDGPPVGLPALASPNSALYVVTAGGLAGFLQFSNPRVGGPGLLLDAQFGGGIPPPDATALAFSQVAAKGLEFGFFVNGITPPGPVVFAFSTSLTARALIPEASTWSLMLVAAAAAGIGSRRRLFSGRILRNRPAKNAAQDRGA